MSFFQLELKQQNQLINLYQKPKIFGPNFNKLQKPQIFFRNKGKNLVKMQKKRESEFNNNRRNYDFVNNAPR